MTTFSNVPAALPRHGPLDPTKHVNYTLGMVLGVDDFTQEFTYLSSRDRWLARDAIGYGALWGLGVIMDIGDNGPHVTVAPGAALTPCGQLVCVTPAQCADVNDWLASNSTAVRAKLAEDGSSTLTAYAVLCYRECATDEVPIPGEPCRTEGELMAPSRLKDDFRLELRVERPLQLEDDAVADFVTWLRGVEVVDGPGTPLADFLDAIRMAAAEGGRWLDSPPHSPPDLASPPFDFLIGSPPSDLAIPRVQVREYLDAAFRLWTTELRPHLRAPTPGCENGCRCGCGCDGAASSDKACEDELLLAELNLPLVFPGGGIELADTGWFADQRTRPYVVHLRLLQEWLLAGAAGEVFPIGSPPSPPSAAGLPILTTSAETVPAGQPAEATLNPVTGDLHFRIPAGPAGVDTATAETVDPGVPAAAEFDPDTRNLHLKIPRGATGAGGTSVTSASATTVGPDQPASASFDPDTGELALEIPAGQPGTSVTSATATTVPAGEPAAAAFDPTTGNLAFEIPAGPPGTSVRSASAVGVPAGSPAAAAFNPVTGNTEFSIPAGAPGTSVRTASAVTLAAGQPATAIFNAITGDLRLGIPQGPQGIPGTGGGPTFLVAAGRFEPRAGGVVFEFGGLKVTPLNAAAMVPRTEGVFLISFERFVFGRPYVVTGTPLTVFSNRSATFEMLPDDDSGFPPGVREAAVEAGLGPQSGIYVRVRTIDNSPSETIGFVVEIDDFGDVI